MDKYIDFKAFRNDVIKALQDTANNYGLLIDTGNIRYDATSFTMQLKCERADVDVNKIRFDADLQYMKYAGFEADDYRREVTIDGKEFVITGFKPGNKYDVCLERRDGKQYAYTSRAVLLALGRKTA